MAAGETRDGSAAGVNAVDPGQQALNSKIKRVAAASAAALVVAQLISLVQTIVLARLLTPTEVGLFAAGTVLTAFLSDFSEGGMRAGLVHRDVALADAAETVFRGTIGTGLLMVVGALVASPVIGIVFHSAEAGAIAAASAGSLLLYSLTNVPEAMLQRQFSVKRRLVVGPSISISFAVTSVTLALLGFGVWSLVIGSYASYVVWVVSVWAITDWRPGRGKFTWSMWREMARYGFPLVMGFVGTRTRQMIESVVVGRGLSTAALGFYRYGTRISQIPVNVIIDVVANALFPAFSRMSDDTERMRRNYLQALGSVTLFAVPLSGLIIAAGEPAVVVLLGEPWRGAGVAVVAMAGMGLGKAFTCVSEEAIKGCNRTSLLNWYTAVEFGVGVVSLLLIIPFGLVGVGLAISITQLTVGVFCLYLAKGVVGITFGQIGRAVVPPIVAGAVAVVAVALLEHQVFHSDTHGIAVGLGLLVVDTLAFLVVYLLALTAVAPAMVRALVPLLLGRRARRG
jgi:O-antigen/teichoic acid export membrane protein